MKVDHVPCGGTKRAQGGQEYFLIEVIFELNLGKVISFSIAERMGVLDRRSAREESTQAEEKL